MALYRYVKKKPKKHATIAVWISYTSLVTGALFLFWSFYPIISFQLYARLFLNQRLVRPVPAFETTTALQTANSVLGDYTILSTNLSDYTKAGVWFPSKPQAVNQEIKIKSYTLSIPRLNIKSAKVVVGGEDLSKSLIHYLPTSYPGAYGNVAIFGHSTLPQLYNPKDYKTIFTYLPSLVKGDKIEVVINETSYEYEVYDTFVVDPDQVSVLDQQYDAAYLTLITCVPPGTAWRRYIVKAKLTQI